MSFFTLGALRNPRPHLVKTKGTAARPDANRPTGTGTNRFGGEAGARWLWLLLSAWSLRWVLAFSLWRIFLSGFWPLFSPFPSQFGDGVSGGFISLISCAPDDNS